MPKVNRPQQARSQRTMNRILDAAADLLEEKAWQDLSIQEIVSAANSSVGSFYARFQDKDGLLQALDDRFFDRLIEQIDAVVADPAWQVLSQSFDGSGAFTTLGGAQAENNANNVVEFMLPLSALGLDLRADLLYHGTFTINSLTHRFGRRRYATSDTSKNSFLLALITLGEGWHNNHHHYQAAARQGFYWWEVDMTYYILKGFEKLGLVRNLRQPPERILNKHLIKQGTADLGMFHAQYERAVKVLANVQFKTAEQKKALEDLLVATRGKIDEIARMSGEKAEELLSKSEPEPELVA